MHEEPDGRTRDGRGGVMRHFASRPAVATVAIAGMVAAMAGVGVVGLDTGTASARPATVAYGVTPTSGPVGTVVTLRGTLPPACATTPTGVVSTVFVEFGKGTGPGEPNEWINVPLGSHGTWAATFVIPPFVGGQAMTQGSLGGDVTPGTWQFGVPTCGAAATVDFVVTVSAPPPSRVVGMAPTPDGRGYWLAQAGGGVFSYGVARFYGSLPGEQVAPAAPITGIAATPDGGGYWLVGADGGVFAFGDAGFYGSLPAEAVDPAGAVVGIAPSPDGKGYWLVGADGGVFAFGDAPYVGNGRDGVAKVALLPTPDGKGYLLTAATGLGPTAAGDATSRQSSPAPLDSLLSGAAMSPDGKGYWEVGSDGGVFAFGDAGFYGSLPATHLTPTAPIVGMARTPDGRGYWLVGADGGVFSFGDAGFYGSAGASGLPW
jgi:hypothetical protein